MPADRPELLDAVRAAVVEGLQHVDRLLDVATVTDPQPPMPPPAGGDGPLPEGLFASTRYRLLRFHRKGGQGEVFVAHDGDLNREALKHASRTGWGTIPTPCAASCWRPKSPPACNTRGSCRSTASARTAPRGRTTSCASSRASPFRTPSRTSTPPTGKRAVTPANGRWRSANC